MRWAVLQHVAYEGPGLLAQVAKRRALRLRLHRLDLRERLPAIDETDGLIVMGGPMGVHDDRAHPYLRAERDLLQDWLALGRPVLGVCLGAQLMAAAVGACVHAGRYAELGAGPVRLTGAGRADPLFAGVDTVFHAFHWHSDTFELPDGAAHLASTPACLQQAFRLGAAQYGLQFHLELTPELTAAMAPHLPAGKAPSASQVRRITRSGDAVFEKYFDLAERALRAATDGSPGPGTFASNER